MELHAQGASEAKISQELKEKLPKAKGLSQSQISKVLLEMDQAENRDENEDDPDPKGTESSQDRMSVVESESSESPGGRLAQLAEGSLKLAYQGVGSKHRSGRL